MVLVSQRRLIKIGYILLGISLLVFFNIHPKQ